jgi:hypothetical protein
VILCAGTTSHRLRVLAGVCYEPKYETVGSSGAASIAQLPGSYRAGCQLQYTLITTRRARRLRSYDFLGLARVYFHRAQLYAENARLMLKMHSRHHCRRPTPSGRPDWRTRRLAYLESTAPGTPSRALRDSRRRHRPRQVSLGSLSEAILPPRENASRLW